MSGILDGNALVITNYEYFHAKIVNWEGGLGMHETKPFEGQSWLWEESKNRRFYNQGCQG